MAIPENPITRKEHFLAKAAGENVNTPDPITREEMYLDAIASGSGGSGGGGSGDNRFIVTCTPTAADYSGTMDKTSAEIDEAWNSGKSIWFIVGGFAAAPISAKQEGPHGNSYSAYIINEAMNALIVATTYIDGNNYDTKIYQLAPMGG